VLPLLLLPLEMVSCTSDVAAIVCALLIVAISVIFHSVMTCVSLDEVVRALQASHVSHVTEETDSVMSVNTGESEGESECENDTPADLEKVNTIGDSIDSDIDRVGDSIDSATSPDKSLHKIEETEVTSEEPSEAGAEEEALHQGPTRAEAEAEAEAEAIKTVDQRQA
jgi:uncharacterized protein YoxC